MHDAVRMRVVEGRTKAGQDGERVFESQLASTEPAGEKRALQELHHEIVLTLIVDADDVRVSEASGGLCLHPEAAAVELDRPCR